MQRNVRSRRKPTCKRRTAEESTKDTGALPLLSYLLDDMWSAMVARSDGVLRLPLAAIELGSVLVERANAFLARNPQSEDALRRLLTLKLATVREDGEPTRRRAGRSEFSDEEWRLVSELADHPNRLLVTATPEGGEPYAEVAHETVFRRWDKLRHWIIAEREFLAWRTELEAARRGWQSTAESVKDDALLMGAALTQAQNWLAKRPNELSKADREFIELSIQRDVSERAGRRRMRWTVILVGTGMLVLAVVAGWTQYLRVMTTKWLEINESMEPNDFGKYIARFPYSPFVPLAKHKVSIPRQSRGL